LVQKMVRLRQITEEQRSAAQALELADLAESRFERLAYLNPEQEATKRIFAWSREAMSQANAELDQESEEIRLAFAGTSGSQVGSVVSKLQHRPVWPDLPSKSGDSTLILALKAEVGAGSAALKAAEASAWPSLGLGPSAELDLNDSSLNSYGLGLSLQLPFWNLNRGERLASAAHLQLSQKELERESNKQALRAEQLKDRYERLRPLYEGGQKAAHAEGYLTRLKDAYLSGRISASLALEGFRQQKEAMESVHRTELKLYETLWEGYRLAGVEAVPEP